MNIKAEEISKIIREQIGSFAVAVDVAEVGTVVSLGDGMAELRRMYVRPAFRGRGIARQLIVAVEEEDTEPGMVVDIVRAGYELRGKVLRPAMVKVAK